MEHTRRLLGCQRKIRSFRANFEKLLAIVQFNRVQLMTAGEFRVIDVLEGHTLEILCMDVSHITKAVASYSPGLLLIHAPIQSDGSFMADHVISLGTLKWRETWRQELQMQVRNLSISQIGDFLAMSGDGFLTVWVRDTPADFSYSQFVYHSKDDTKGIIAQVLRQDTTLGSVIEQEVTHDGRLIVCLEERSRTLRVYYQDTLLEKEKEERKEAPRQDYHRGGYNNYRGYRSPNDDRVEISLDFNPYANLDAGTDFEAQARQGGDLRYQHDEVNCYMVAEHSHPIDYFRFMHHDIYESEKRYLPNLLLTVTSRNEVFLWQEDLMQPGMQFTCVHAFRQYGKVEYFDATFLEFPPINPKRYVELRASVSKLFDSASDRVLALKKEDNEYGIFKQNYAETSIDWLMVLNDSILDIYKAEGLRTFPQRSIEVNLWNRVKMTQHPRDFLGSVKILSASCRDFNDVLSLYTLNTGGQLLKLRKDFREEGVSKWRVDKVAILKRRYIEAVVVHQQLPIIAHLMNNSDIYFFIEEKTKNRIVKESVTGGSMTFLGAYSVYHVHASGKKPAQPLSIVRAKWVTSPLCMMLVHYTNDAIALVSSQTQLRILSHRRFQQEYLKLWQARGIEKWEKLFEFHFAQAATSVEGQEHIVDFEVVGSKLIDGGNGFQINVAIFTSFNQYLVFETQTTLLEGLKTLSQTKLLYHVYTTDCPLRLLGSIHFQSEWSSQIQGERTVLALLSEVIPGRQRPERFKQEAQAQLVEEAPSPEELSEDDDDGDIFASSSPKRKPLTLKHKQVPAPIQTKAVEQAPLKPCMVVKMVQFDEEGEKRRSWKELWHVELPLEFTLLKCRTSEQFFAFMTKETSGGYEGQLIVYIYDLLQNKYLGFISLNNLFGTRDHLQPDQVDFIFSSATSKGSLTVYHKDSLYLIAESSREGMRGKWSLVRRLDSVMGVGRSQQIQSISIAETYLRKQVLLLNKSIVKVSEKFKLTDLQSAGNEGETVSVVSKLGLHSIYAHAQKSFPIYHPKVLKKLFIKGYTGLVLKVLVQLSKSLDAAHSAPVPDFLDFDLQQIDSEVNELIQSKASESAAPTKKKQETASSIFDDFYGGGRDDDDGDIFAPKKKAPESNGSKNTKQLETQFDDCFKDLVSKVKAFGEKALGIRDERHRLQFVDFLKRFKQIYRKDFFADPLTSILLKDLFFDTEDVTDEMEPSSGAGKDFNRVDFVQQLRGGAGGLSKANIGSIPQWNSLQTCLALHSEMQDVLLNEIQDRFDFESNLNYDIMKKLCIPIWLKDTLKLKNLVTTIAKNEYKSAGDDFGKTSKAEKTALWYIMLDRKDQLTRLYKQETAYKKVYELLLNDFTLPKWKTTAEKNAMVLMSKKNYLLSCAFFLLAGNLKDAVSIAIDKMSDPVLAVLMTRLTEKESFTEEKRDETMLQRLYREQFVERGTKLEDPYLRNIGHWQRKEYVKALNAFHVEPTQMNIITGFFSHQTNTPDQNIFYSAEPIVIADKQKYLLEQAAAKNQQENIPVPLSTTYEYCALDIIKVLRKSTMVKRMVQQGASSKGMPSIQEEDSIFDDFFGGASKPKKTPEQIRQEEIEALKLQEESRVTVEDHKVLEYVTLRTSQSGFTLQALLLMAENADQVVKTSPLSKQIIGYTLIGDYVNSPTFQYQSIQRLKSSTALLLRRLELDQDKLRAFILKQFKYNESFLMNVNFIVEDESLDKVQQRKNALSCVEEQALKMVDFVLSIADFPFTVVQDGKSHDFVDYTIKKAVSYLEALAESYIILDTQSSAAAVAEPVTSPTTSPPLGKMVSLSIADFDNGEGNYEYTVENEKNNFNLRGLDVKTKMIEETTNSVAGQVTLDAAEQQLQDVSARTRITLVIYLGLLQVCMISRKFALVRDLLADLKSIFSSSLLSSEKESETVGVLMQKLKTQIQKFKHSLVKVEPKPEEVDDFELKLQQAKPKSKEQIEQEALHLKVDSFFEIWLQYIITHTLQQLIQVSYDKTKIAGFIDLRPSLVEVLPMNIVVEHILNPRISSQELLKKFVHMDRVLENVTTYYFENFLTLAERSIISSELLQIQSNRFDSTNAKTLDPGMYFGSGKKFSEFAAFIDLGGYIKQLRDHELSVVYHANHDYSTKAVERTQALFENGIDIFRMKSETCGGFAFDHCDLDMVALTLHAKGIREIPIRKSLLYRTRSAKGHQVVDEEQGSWHECLNRFNRAAQDQKDIKPQGDAIIAAYERLYQYKTINYAKKFRRTRGTFFLDYEMNPPDIWSGLKYSEYLKCRSDADITHEEYSAGVESHPYLPLYVTGNNKGMLCLWEYNQIEDKALDQWTFDSLESRKSIVRKVAFNSYGDKIFSANQDGHIFVFNFDNMESSRTLPVFSLRKNKEDKVSDFEVLNQDTVFAVTSQKPKHLWVYDLLMGSRGGLVQDVQIGGSIIQPFRTKSQLILFNVEKPGTLALFDLKMNKVVFSTSLHSDEITSVAFNEAETTLVAGFKDGIIKILNIPKDFEARETYSAFSSAGAKKGGVSQVRVHPTNGALYAASTIGNLKLFRIRV